MILFVILFLVLLTNYMKNAMTSINLIKYYIKSIEQLKFITNNDHKYFRLLLFQNFL